MFTMYGFTLLYGNAATAFDGPFSVVITEDKAVKYFGKKDVVGQTLTIENFPVQNMIFIITGVMKMPAKILQLILQMIIITSFILLRKT